MFTGRHFLFFLVSFYLMGALAISAEIGLIGFSSPSDGYWQIWTLNPNTGKLRQATSTPVDKKEPVWTNDGKKLVYRTGNAKFHLFHMDTGKDAVILDRYGKVFDPDISPDNKHLLFTRFKTDVLDNSDIWMFDFGNETAKKLTNGPRLLYDPAWSPGGNEIAFVLSGKKGIHTITVMDRDGGNPVGLTNNSAFNIHPDWSPDGKKIVFASNVTGNYDIRTMDRDGKNKTRLTHDSGLDTQPAWSPDGKEILFVSNRLGCMGIWIMKSDGSDQKPLTPKDMKCADPVWIFK